MRPLVKKIFKNILMNFSFLDMHIFGVFNGIKAEFDKNVEI